ncbi:MAG: MerR family transcriptional regulator [Hominenteromicrobium sp.]
MTYSVREAAKLLGVAPSALRYYDKEGLLPFVTRTESGTRVFREEDLRWLRLIRCLKASGMPIKSIRRCIELEMQGDETIDERLKLFEEQREAVCAQMEQLQRTLETLEYKCWYFETAKRCGSVRAVQDMPDEALPENIRAARRRLRQG